MPKLKDLFHIEYGNQADLNKLQEASFNNGVRFISRSSEDLGFQCYVKPVKELKIYKKGSITVTLGGSYLLSAFVQPGDFYTAQNIKVLTPKKEMSESVKYFYCYAIAKNRFRYTTHGREANKTLDDLPVPSKKDIPEWVYASYKINEPSTDPYRQKDISFKDRPWNWFFLKDYFSMYAGKYYPADSYNAGETPLVTSTNKNNGVRELTNLSPVYDKTCLTIGKISASTFVQPVPFVASPDVTVLVPKEKFNVQIGLFISTLINLESYKWSYGRQIRLSDSMKLKIKLPSTKNKAPDWEFMEYYMNTLPYSSSINPDTKPSIKNTPKDFSSSESDLKKDLDKVILSDTQRPKDSETS